jgi:hypothetical protein
MTPVARSNAVTKSGRHRRRLRLRNLIVDLVEHCLLHDRSLVMHRLRLHLAADAVEIVHRGQLPGGDDHVGESERVGERDRRNACQRRAGGHAKQLDAVREEHQ